MNFTREQLHERHRLSHQQIDRWIGENTGKRFVNEKVRQLERVKTFLTISSLLKKHDVYFINIKGPLLSYRIYGDPTVRISHDVDFLVDIKDIDRVAKILFEYGFRLAEGISWPQKKAEKQLQIKSMHHLSFYGPRMEVIIEMHWVLSQILPVSFKRQRKLILENTENVEFGEQELKCLGKELELVYLILHGSQHGWSRLKWLVDIADYPVEEIDERKFYKLVKQLNAERAISQTNYMLETFYDKKLPFYGAKRLPKFLIRFAFKSIEDEIQTEKSLFKLLEKQRNYLSMFSRPHYKMRIIWGAFIRNKQEFLLTNVLFKLLYIFYLPYNFIKRRILHAG